MGQNQAGWDKVGKNVLVDYGVVIESEGSPFTNHWTLARA